LKINFNILFFLNHDSVNLSDNFRSIQILVTQRHLQGSRNISGELATKVTLWVIVGDDVEAATGGLGTTNADTLAVLPHELGEVTKLGELAHVRFLAEVGVVLDLIVPGLDSGVTGGRGIRVR